jgi:hypothetical protein
MKSHRWLMTIFLSLFFVSCAKAGTYSLSVRYQPLRDFPSLQQKIGSSIGLAPFKDERPDTLYIGIHTHLRGASSQFKSDPFPLEKAITDSLSQVFPRYGIKTFPISNWDGNPESLKTIEPDSVLMIEIKRFWTEGKASFFRTHAKTSIHFVIHLGIKKENKVFTRNVEIDKERTVARLTPEIIQEMINQMLTEIFDVYLSNPY